MHSGTLPCDCASEVRRPERVRWASPSTKTARGRHGYRFRFSRPIPPAIALATYVMPRPRLSSVIALPRNQSRFRRALPRMALLLSDNSSHETHERAVTPLVALRSHGTERRRRLGAAKAIAGQKSAQGEEQSPMLMTPAPEAAARVAEGVLLEGGEGCGGSPAGGRFGRRRTRRSGRRCHRVHCAVWSPREHGRPARLPRQEPAPQGLALIGANRITPYGFWVRSNTQ
jgi:hypothetical protein